MIGHFTLTEELEEAARNLGWDIHYQQLHKGSFLGEVNSLSCDDVHWVLESFNNHLLISIKTPDEYTGFFFPNLAEGIAKACGHTLKEGEIVILPAQSEMEITTCGTIQNYTLFLPEEKFLSVAHSLILNEEKLIEAEGPASVCRVNPLRFAGVQESIADIFKMECLDSETNSNLLTNIILMLSDGFPLISKETLANNYATGIALLAQRYIEDSLHKTIRMEELCRSIGAGLRTVQRFFKAYFQVTPCDYIKARRLYRARQKLQEANRFTSKVTDIAMASGFDHLGRFSVDYRNHFGESPKDTLSVSGNTF